MAIFSFFYFYFGFFFFPGKFFWYQKDNVSYHQFSAHADHLAQGKSEVAARLCPAAKHFNWGEKKYPRTRTGCLWAVSSVFLGGWDRNEELGRVLPAPGWPMVTASHCCLPRLPADRSQDRRVCIVPCNTSCFANNSKMEQNRSMPPSRGKARLFLLQKVGRLRTEWQAVPWSPYWWQLAAHLYVTTIQKSVTGKTLKRKAVRSG